MFYRMVTTNLDGLTQTHIVQVREDGSVHAFLEGYDNEYAPAYAEWLAEGNEPGPWPPEEVSE